jgi:hypothetical protein
MAAGESKRLAFLSEAASHVGYTSRPNRNSFYGEQTGYNSNPWSGSFIDFVANRTNVDIPSCVYSTAALQYFVQSGRMHVRPKPGDIVFFAFSTGAHFEMPHVGIVTDVQGITFNGSFKTIEAEIDPGTPKGQHSRDSVHERIRYLTDVVAFGRPDFKRNRLKASGGAAAQTFNEDGRAPQIVLARVISGKPNQDVELVQRALSTLTDLQNSKRGVFDAGTKSAFANFQRSVGYVGPDASGIPDQKSLELLAARTSGKYFRI